MSVKVMSAVWENYPVGGGELVLALALADHAHDDGTHIWPKVATLAKKTRQSERTVQYQLRKMESDGFITLVNQGKGGRNLSREYAINMEHINGANAAPVDDVKEPSANGETFASFLPGKGANDNAQGCNPQQETVQFAAQKGAAAIAPAYNRQTTIKEPSNNHKAKPPKSDETSKAFVGVDEIVAEGVERQHAVDWLAVRKAKSKPLTLSAWTATKREAAKAGLTVAQAVQTLAESGWIGFKADYVAKDARAVPAQTPTCNMSPRDASRAAAANSIGLGTPNYDNELFTIDADFQRIG
ncbi:helix-turn-helix domain-containing protein [Caballeronia sp. RCC_10]|uniref:helix-turn-helix domain-containing protein n=1 Tax=Caballeronia sp. RCC_10 TaxID=3239227 RepID=UPI0035251F3F